VLARAGDNQVDHGLLTGEEHEHTISKLSDAKGLTERSAHRRFREDP